jgi:hypothetical protein
MRRTFDRRRGVARWNDQLRQIIPGRQTASHKGIDSPEALAETRAAFRKFLDGE